MCNKAIAKTNSGYKWKNCDINRSLPQNSLILAIQFTDPVILRHKLLKEIGCVFGFASIIPLVQKTYESFQFIRQGTNLISDRTRHSSSFKHFSHRIQPVSQFAQEFLRSAGAGALASGPFGYMDSINRSTSS